MEILTRTPWSRIREQNSVYKEFLEIVGNGKPTGSAKGDKCSFRHDFNKCAKSTQPNIILRALSCSRTRGMRREPEVPEEIVSVVESRWPCKDHLRGTCSNSFCEKWHPPECLFYKTKSGCRFGKKWSFAHRQVDEQPTKRSKKNDDKSALAMLKKNDWHENERA